MNLFWRFQHNRRDILTVDCGVVVAVSVLR